MTRLQTMRRIVLPQAMRVIIPPTGNEMISMLKTTSLVCVIAVTELLYAVAADLRAQLQDDPAADRGVHLVPGLDVDALVGQYYLERRSRAGSSRSAAARCCRACCVSAQPRGRSRRR